MSQRITTAGLKMFVVLVFFLTDRESQLNGLLYILGFRVQPSVLLSHKPREEEKGV